MDNFLNKTKTPDFSIPSVRQEFVQNTHDTLSLLHKEMDVNLVEQNLLKQRIALMSEFINDLPSSDPQYSMLCIQVKMDQVELDELDYRRQHLIQLIENEGSKK